MRRINGKPVNIGGNSMPQMRTFGIAFVVMGLFSLAITIALV